MAKRNFSSKRNAIYEAVCSTTTHPSAHRVYERLKPDIPDLSLGTVYRNIALFKQEGMVNVVCSVDGEERIDGNTSPHPHFVCGKCKAVIDVDYDLSAEKIQSVLKSRGYIVESENVVCFGICPKCAQEHSEAKLQYN